MQYASVLSVLLILLINIDYIYTLECYVCKDQEDNGGKCTTTIKTCQQEEDVCLTDIRWGSTPYWTQGALKQFYITKNCSSKDKCQRYREANMDPCTRIWYEDWHCSECCRGDRCNYFVISSGHKKVESYIVIWVLFFVTFF